MTNVIDPTDAARATLDAARSLLRQGRAVDAERAYERVLETTPDSIEALNIVGAAFLRKGQPEVSIALLERAVKLRYDDAISQMNLGLAYDGAGRAEEALAALRRAVTARPDYPPARLHLGATLARLGQEYAATCQLFRAIVDAQAKGAWLAEASTPPPLRAAVTSAIRYVAVRRRELLEMALAPLYTRHGREAMTRVEECLSGYLGDLEPRYADARQKPTFLFFPGLPTSAYFDRALFPWMDELESRTTDIRDELQSVMQQAAAREPVFHSAELAGANLRGPGVAPVWEGIYFYRHGERKAENCRRCPRTAQAIDAVPVVRIREHAPEVMLSVLTPGTHILPHRGVTNTRVVAHLPLVVPGNCALNVGGELHTWEEGRGVVFDDTFEHEAWNRSGQTRVILILDVWNPYLTPAERDAMPTLVEAIAGFRKDWQET